jgi:hypothetical protein
MAYPTTIDNFTNPASGDQLNSPSHSQQHKNINDAVEALEAKVGVDSSAVTTSHDYKIAQLEGASHSPVTVTDSSEIDFTLDGQEITASLKSGSIDETKLDTSVNASLDKADSALQDVVDDTTPQLGGQLDVNGNAIGDGTLELLKFSETASAVNEITIKNNSTGNAPEIQATGDDTNIDLNLVPKGTGGVQVGGVNLKKTQSTADASSITPTGNAYENEIYVTALAQALTINAPSGTASNGNTLLIRIKDNATARALTWNAIYTFIGTTKPTTTVAGKILYVGAIYNSTATKWEVISINQEA